MTGTPANGPATASVPQSDARPIRCVVVGGSLVGLSAAIALSRLGAEVTVAERSPVRAVDGGGGLGVDVALLRQVTGIDADPPVLHGIDRDGNRRLPGTRGSQNRPVSATGGSVLAAHAARSLSRKIYRQLSRTSSPSSSGSARRISTASIRAALAGRAVISAVAFT